MVRVVLVILAVGALTASANAAEPRSHLGRQVEDFALKDYRGKTHQLSDVDSKLVVLAFLGTECPLARLYGPRLAEIERRYAERGVAVLGVNSNVQDSTSEIAAYARLHKLDFPIVKDLGNRLADQLGAVRTPEVFLLDARRTVRYWGRIDDQWGVGYVREEPTRHDLIEAIDALLAGEAVARPITESVGCHIGRIKTPSADAEVTYANQISRLLQRRCVECHREGEIAPFALTEYDEVVGWAEMIDEVVREQRMPPWHAAKGQVEFGNDRRLTDEEKQLIHDWVAAGAPRGDESQLPPPRQFTSGWRLPREPDAVVPIIPEDQEPFHVPPRGEVRYKYFRVDPGFTADKWIEAAEIQPGNRAVVHHVLCFARPPGLAGGLSEGGAGGYLVGYVPGLRPQPFPQGMAKRIAAGSELIFQVHYTPIGSEQLDRSRLGLVFADPNTITHEVQTTSAVGRGIRIPPGAPNHKEEAWSRRPLNDARLLSMMPHMHLRGKAFRYEAVHPDGERMVLLDVPQYDFNWQTAYQLAEPLRLPEGTRIHCTAHYDNSDANLNNPDPTQSVRWGDQTWEEMMIGYFNIAVPRSAEESEGEGRSAPADRRSAMVAIVARRLLGDLTPVARARQIVARYDSNRDGKVERDEVPQRLQPIFDALDGDRDGLLTEAETAASLERLSRQ
ncbi:MAG: redoxin domain-containing protein [Pirellulaceae bacterium]